MKEILNDLLKHCDFLIESNKKIDDDWVNPFISGVYAVRKRISHELNKLNED